MRDINIKNIPDTLFSDKYFLFPFVINTIEKKHLTKTLLMTLYNSNTLYININKLYLRYY